MIDKKHTSNIVGCSNKARNQHHQQRQRRRKVPNYFSSRTPELHVVLSTIFIALVQSTSLTCNVSCCHRRYLGIRLATAATATPNTATYDVMKSRKQRKRRNSSLHNSQFFKESKPTISRHLEFYTPLISLVSSIQTSRIGTTTTRIGYPANNCNGNSWWKAAVSGSVAGAVATTLLYPLDAAKTLRQAHIASITTTAASTGTCTATVSSLVVVPPIASVYDALRHLIRQGTVYVGLSTAILGAIPSSALYFGAYETSKSLIGRTFLHRANNHHHHQRRQTSITVITDSEWERDVTILQRCLWHSTSAAIGNMISSAVFVPKEVIKQQMQYSGTGTWNVFRTVQHIIIEKGVKNGLYIGYRATVLRNIPSAALRFTFYEELKRYINRGNSKNHSKNNAWKLYIAGAIAGAMASGIMTPMDLIKTKLSTGTCPVNEVQGCIQHVIEQNGIIALWTGAGSRMISSALFSAIGFGTFEACQSYLNHHQLFSQRCSENHDHRKQIAR